jgi:Flp pilus assembly protein TadG
MISFTNLKRSLASDERGNVAIQFALLALPVFGIVGAAVDYAQAYRIKGRMQHAADAAAMAAGTAQHLDEQARISLAMTYYRDNVSFGSPETVADPEVAITSTGVSVEAEYQMDTAFLGILGIEHIDLAVATTVTTTGKSLELSLMLDTTGSMLGTRLADMKDAANDLLDIVLPDGATNTRVAVVPFATYVNVGTTNRTALTGRTDYPNASCVLERKRGSRTNEDPPVLGTSEFWISNTTSSNCPPSAPIIPLTSNKSTLTTAINGLAANGATSGHLGTAWAWYTISPQWASRWPTASAPVSYTQSDNIKAVVLMTDGNYTEFHRNADGTSASCNGSDDCSKSRTEAKNLCDAMKTRLDAAGNEAIMIFTVGFGLEPEGTTNGDFARDTLKHCASYDPQDPETDLSLKRKLYFFPYSGEDMRQAFQQIGQALSAAKTGARISR